MSAIVAVCKGIPILWVLSGHMECSDTQAKPDPQAVVCSGPAVPLLTLEEAQQTIPKVRRFMNKVKRNRRDNNCPETIERKETQ
jgi:hypothetical protein